MTHRPPNPPPTNAQQSLDNQHILQLLAQIHANSEAVLIKVEQLQTTTRRQAMIYGAMSGGTAGAMMAVGVELIKAKYGL